MPWAIPPSPSVAIYCLHVATSGQGYSEFHQRPSVVHRCPCQEVALGIGGPQVGHRWSIGGLYDNSDQRRIRTENQIRTKDKFGPNGFNLGSHKFGPDLTDGHGVSVRGQSCYVTVAWTWRFTITITWSWLFHDMLVMVIMEDTMIIPWSSWRKPWSWHGDHGMAIIIK